MSAADRLCVIIDATRAGPFELMQMDAISHACEGLADVWLVTNKAGASLRPRHIVLPNDVVFAPATNHKDATQIVPGNSDMKLMALMRHSAMADYRRFFRMEFDCVFARPIRESVERLDALSRQYDIGYLQGFSSEDFPEWVWWSGFGNGRQPDMPRPGPLRGAFVPAVLMSRRFIETYEARLREGWRGHFELLMPTFARWDGLSEVDFARLPEFTLDKSVYTIWRPEAFDHPESRLFHPVKSFEAMARLPGRVLSEYRRHAPEAVAGGLPLLASAGLDDSVLDLARRALRSADSPAVWGPPALAELAAMHEPQRVTYVTSVRADAVQVAQHPRLAEDRQLGVLRIEFAALGPTDRWGNPQGEVSPQRLARYLVLPQQPVDLGVLFGRFRVALATLLYGQPAGAPQLIVGDMGRAHYAPILELYERVEAAGSALLLRPLPGREAEAAAIAAAHAADPR